MRSNSNKKLKDLDKGVFGLMTPPDRETMDLLRPVNPWPYVKDQIEAILNGKAALLNSDYMQNSGVSVGTRKFFFNPLIYAHSLPMTIPIGVQIVNSSRETNEAIKRLLYVPTTSGSSEYFVTIQSQSVGIWKSCKLNQRIDIKPEKTKQLGLNAALRKRDKYDSFVSSKKELAHAVKRSFTNAVCLTYVLAHKLLVVGSADMEMRLLSAQFETQFVVKLKSSILNMTYLPERDQILLVCLGKVSLYSIVPNSMLHKSQLFQLEEVVTVPGLNETDCPSCFFYVPEEDLFFLAVENTLYIYKLPEARQRYGSGIALTEKKAQLVCLHGDDSITSVAYYPPFQYTITSGRKGNIRVWNNMFNLLFELNDHVKAVTALAIAEENRSWRLAGSFPFLLSSSLDSTIKIWSLENAQCVQSIYTGDSVMGLRMIKKDTFCYFTKSEFFVANINALHMNFRETNSSAVFFQRIEQHCNTPARLLVCFSDNSIRLLSPLTGEQIGIGFPTDKNTQMKQAAYLPNAKKIVTLFTNGQVAVYDITANPFMISELRYRPFEEPIKALNQLCTINVHCESSNKHFEWLFGGTKAGQIVLVAVTDQENDFQTVCQAHTNEILLMASENRHKLLFTYGKDGTIKFWALSYVSSSDQTSGSSGEKETNNLKRMQLHLIGSLLVGKLGSPVSEISIDPENCKLCFIIEARMYFFSYESLLTLQKQESAGNIEPVVMTENDIEQQKQYEVSNLKSHSKAMVLANHSSDNQTTLLRAVPLPVNNFWATLSAIGAVKIWNQNCRLVREMLFGEAIHSLGVANKRGDLLVGIDRGIRIVPVQNYLSPSALPCLLSLKVEDDAEESPMPYNPSVPFWNYKKVKGRLSALRSSGRRANKTEVSARNALWDESLAIWGTENDNSDELAAGNKLKKQRFLEAQERQLLQDRLQDDAEMYWETGKLPNDAESDPHYFALLRKYLVQCAAAGSGLSPPEISDAVLDEISDARNEDFLKPITTIALLETESSDNLELLLEKGIPSPTEPLEVAPSNILTRALKYKKYILEREANLEKIKQTEDQMELDKNEELKSFFVSTKSNTSHEKKPIAAEPKIKQSQSTAEHAVKKEFFTRAQLLRAFAIADKRSGNSSQSKRGKALPELSNHTNASDKMMNQKMSLDQFRTILAKRQQSNKLYVQKQLEVTISKKKQAEIDEQKERDEILKRRKENADALLQMLLASDSDLNLSSADQTERVGEAVNTPVLSSVSELDKAALEARIEIAADKMEPADNQNFATTGLDETINHKRDLAVKENNANGLGIENARAVSTTASATLESVQDLEHPSANAPSNADISFDVIEFELDHKDFAASGEFLILRKEVEPQNVNDVDNSSIEDRAEAQGVQDNVSSSQMDHNNSTIEKPSEVISTDIIHKVVVSTTEECKPQTQEASRIEQVFVAETLPVEHSHIDTSKAQDQAHKYEVANAPKVAESIQKARQQQKHSALSKFAQLSAAIAKSKEQGSEITGGNSNPGTVSKEISSEKLRNESKKEKTDTVRSAENVIDEKLSANKIGSFDKTTESRVDTAQKVQSSHSSGIGVKKNFASEKAPQIVLKRRYSVHPMGILKCIGNLFLQGFHIQVNPENVYRLQKTKPRERIKASMVSKHFHSLFVSQNTTNESSDFQKEPDEEEELNLLSIISSRWYKDALSGKATFNEIASNNLDQIINNLIHIQLLATNSELLFNASKSLVYIFMAFEDQLSTETRNSISDTLQLLAVHKDPSVRELFAELCGGLIYSQVAIFEIFVSLLADPNYNIQKAALAALAGANIRSAADAFNHIVSLGATSETIEDLQQQIIRAGYLPVNMQSLCMYKIKDHAGELAQKNRLQHWIKDQEALFSSTATLHERQSSYESTLVAPESASATRYVGIERHLSDTDTEIFIPPAGWKGLACFNKTDSQSTLLDSSYTSAVQSRQGTSNGKNPSASTPKRPQTSVGLRKKTPDTTLRRSTTANAEDSRSYVRILSALRRKESQSTIVGALERHSDFHSHAKKGPISHRPSTARIVAHTLKLGLNATNEQ